MGRPVMHKYETLKPVVDEWLKIAKTQTFDKIVLNPKTGEQTTLKLKKPLTIQSFILFAKITRQTYLDILNDKEYKIYEKDLVDMFTRVHEIIQDNQISGAILNEYNANIVSRINGITDTVNVESNLQPVINIALPNFAPNFVSLQENNIQDVEFKEVKPLELTDLNTDE